MWAQLYTVGQAVIAGATYSISNYWRKAGEDPKLEFDWSRFGSTLVGGAFIGTIGLFLGIDMVSAESFFMQFGGIVLVDKLWKAITSKLTG